LGKPVTLVWTGFDVDNLAIAATTLADALDHSVRNLGANS